MSTVALKPVVAPRASEAIYEQIRGMILNGELKPGDHLPSERQMMETVSYTHLDVYKRQVTDNGLFSKTAPFSFDRVQDNELRFILTGFGIFNRIGNCLHVVAIDTLHIPAELFKLCPNIAPVSYTHLTEKRIISI